jgi:hypothetical protein
MAEIEGGKPSFPPSFLLRESETNVLLTANLEYGILDSRQALSEPIIERKDR